MGDEPIIKEEQQPEAPKPAAPAARLERPEGFRQKLWDAADDKRKREILALDEDARRRYSATAIWPKEAK